MLKVKKSKKKTHTHERLHCLILGTKYFGPKPAQKDSMLSGHQLAMEPSSVITFSFTADKNKEKYAKYGTCVHEIRSLLVIC